MTRSGSCLTCESPVTILPGPDDKTELWACSVCGSKGKLAYREPIAGWTPIRLGQMALPGFEL